MRRPGSRRVASITRASLLASCLLAAHADHARALSCAGSHVEEATLVLSSLTIDGRPAAITGAHQFGTATIYPDADGKLTFLVKDGAKHYWAEDYARAP